jgi:hypothetical protein
MPASPGGQIKVTNVTTRTAHYGRFTMGGTGCVRKDGPRPAGRPGPRTRLDEGLLSFCLPILILYGDSPLEPGETVVTNDSAPSYVHLERRADLDVRGALGQDLRCPEESTLQYGPSYNSSYNPPHNKRK